MSCTNTLTFTVPQHNTLDPLTLAATIQALLNNPQHLNALPGLSLRDSSAPQSLPTASQQVTLQYVANTMVHEYAVLGHWEVGSTHKYRSQLQQIINLLGPDRLTSSLCTDDLTNLKASLKHKNKNSLSLPEVDLSWDDLEESEGNIGGETIHRYFNLLKRFIIYCEESNYPLGQIDMNVKLAGKSPTTSHYLTFDPTELEAILTSRVYTTEPTERFRWTPYSYCFWLPLLGVFTGARPGELCQLYAGDVFEESGIPVIRITDRGPLQRLKTDASARHIPIHPQLLATGFLDFVAMRRKEGGRFQPLFPELPYDQRHGHARAASRWFSGQGITDLGYLSACGLSKGMGYCLYSFRHTFIDMLRKVGVQEMMIKTLVGHTLEDDVTINYGQNFSLAQRHEKLAHLRLDVDLSHIAWENYQRLQRLKPHCQKNRRAATQRR
ncbi:site-specific integrase [Metapseudomonas lalkuanensis]|uniref:Site-specific integrase n=1 Tax=Metapseudomonas lalkuanensis TaxID=2604832 RepID=A0A5J6QQG5_9GAMM|nr:site-specific integrase [Pseudomonas lalkuanensis]QEY64968.1 site-specific integrase [Pseudomonas lalkuanensis]